MGTAAAVIGLVSALVGGASAYHQSQKAADARDDARDQMKLQAQRDAEIHMRDTEKLTSKQRALYAASGVKVDDGSPLAVILASQADAEEERQAIAQGYGYRTDALGKDANAIRTTGYLNTAGTLLGGAATYASSPYGKNPFAASSSPLTPGPSGTTSIATARWSPR
jgi:hypothetical protein